MQLWWRIALIGLGTSVVPLDTAVNVAFPAITRGFDLPLEAIQWVVICYVLTYASLVLAFGRIGDIVGHARVFRAGLLASSAAFLLCAAAPGYGWLLFFRFLQGIGAGLVISCAPALATGLFPEARRSRALGAFNMMFALGSALGPLLGGVLVQHWDWPGVFWFRAPIALVALLASAGLPRAVGRAEREPLDVLGAVLLALGLAALLLSLNRFRYIEAGDYSAVAIVAVALASLVLFGRRERRAAHPIISFALFRLPGFAVFNAANVLVNLASFAVLLLVPYYLARGTDLPVAIAGTLLAASFAGAVAASPAGGWILERVPAERLAAIGALLVGAGLAGIGSWRAGEPVPAMLAALVTQGIGLGVFQVAYMEIVMGAVARQHHGVAGSLAMLTRTIGVVSGATMLMLAFQHFAAATPGDAASIEGFLAPFRWTFRAAAALSLAVGIVAATAPRARR